MRTEVIEKKIFKFVELSDSAKEKAREWYRNASAHDDWYDFVIDDCKTIAALIGWQIESIGYSGFWSQGDGAHFTGRIGYAKGCYKSVIAYAPNDQELARIAYEWQALQRVHFYKLSAEVSHRGHYQHENCTSFEVYKDDEYTDAAIEESVKEIARDYMRWIYARLESEYNYLNSDEQVDESITANEYEFEENGSVY
jgi:hypothetical protein